MLKINRAGPVAAVLFALTISCTSQPNNNPDSLRIGTIVESIETNPIVFYHDSNMNYWFGGGESVYKYNGSTLIKFTSADGLSCQSVIDIKEDQYGNIFFDSQEGVCMFDGEQFIQLEIEDAGSAEAVWLLNEDDLWFRGGWNRPGPLRYDGKKLYQLELPQSPRADTFYNMHPNVSYSPYGTYTMYRDSQGALWFGTASLGACRYDGLAFNWLYEKHHSKTPEGGDFGIRSIIEDRNGDFWFCNTRYRYSIELSGRDSTTMTYTRKPGLSGDGSTREYPYFMSAVEDDMGQLWFATYDDGVWCKQGEELIHFPMKEEDQQVLAFAIERDRNGTIWLMTHNSGIYRFADGGFSHFIP